jgi:hypothetical protein
MIELDIPETPTHAITLMPETRVTLAPGAATASPMQNLVSLGVPQSFELTPGKVAPDDELKNFLNNESATTRFDLVRFICSFTPTNASRVVEAWFQISLSHLANDGPGQPIAWSMAPQKLTEKTQVTRTVKIGGSLKLFDAGIDTGGVVVTNGVIEKPFLIARKEASSTPEWYFKELENVRLDGNYELTMVVKNPGKARVTGKIELLANIREVRYGIFPMSFKASLENSPAASFTLG